MARVLVTYNHNFAIEISRGPKWSTLVTMGSTIQRERLQNYIVDRHYIPSDYPLDQAICRFLKPSMSSTHLSDGAAALLGSLASIETDAAGITTIVYKEQVQRKPRRTASSVFQTLLLAGDKTDDEIFQEVQAEFGLAPEKRSYVSWHRSSLKRQGKL